MTMDFIESEADQLCILRVYLENYTLAEMSFCLLELGLISLTTCANKLSKPTPFTIRA